MDQIQDKEEKFPEVIIDILKTKHWDYKQTEVNPPTIRWEYTGDHGKWSIYLRYIPAVTTLVCYSVFPVDAPLHRRTEMLTLITRLNVMVTGGSFQMDLDDGEILFKTSLFFDNIELTHALVGNIIEQNLKLMNQCFRGMMAVMYKKCSVEDGIRLIEAQEIT
jgi:hypothetical protein